jgi:hypothetical protein
MKHLPSSLLALFLVVQPLAPVLAADHALTHSKNAQDEVNVLDLTVGTCTVGTVLECVGTSGQIGLGTDDIAATSIDDSNNNSVISILTLEHTTSGTPSAGIGSRLTFKIEDAGGTEDQGYLDVLLTDVTENSEDIHLNILIQQAGDIEEIISVEGDNKRILLGDSNTALTNAVSDRLTLLHRTTGTPAAGFGLGLTFEIEDAGGPEEQGSIDVELDVVASGSEEATMTFDINLAGTMTEVMRLDGTAGFASFGGVATVPAEAIEVENANATTALQISNSATDGDPYLAWALSGTKAFSMGVDDGDSDKLKIGTTAIGTATMLEFDSSGNLRVLVGIDAIGAVDLDIGSADVTDVTVVTDGGTVVIDGSITQDAGTTLAMGGTLDATGAVDMDYGSGDITDHTFTTDGGTVVLDGSITQDAGTTLFMGGTLDATGAVDMDYGSADITDHTFTTDGTGTAEVALPAGSIDSTELLNDTILNADINSSAGIVLSKTALVAGTNITLSTNTLNVDDAFLVNNGSDTTTGTLTAAGYVGNLYDASGSVDLDIGSADVTDVTVVTDGGTVVLDGSITQDAGTTLTMGGTLDATGAVDMDYGSADITDHTFTTDGGTVVIDGNIAMTDVDPNIIFNVTSSTDTDYWIGVTEDAGGDDDDLFQIGDGTTPGTNPFLTINTSGNVGIGVSDPDALLEINGQIKITGGSPGSGKVLQSDGNGVGSWATAAGGGEFADGGDTAEAARVLGNNDSYDLGFETNGATRMTITAAGKVGIALAPTDGTLHVHTATAGTIAAGSWTDDLVVENSGSGGISIITPDANNAYVSFLSPSAQEGANIKWSFDAKDMELSTHNAASKITFSPGNEALAVTMLGTGKVGIGIADPDGELHVHTGSAGSVTAYANADELVVEGGGESGISILTADANNGYLVFGSASSNLVAYVKSHYNNGILQLGTAKVGGNIKFRSGNDVEVMVLDETGLATFRQDVYITDLSAVGTDPLCWDGSGASLIGDCSSLREWKSNIVDTDMGLAEVLQLRAREFDWDEQHGHGKHDVGFVAEEVEEVNPLLVTYRPELTGVKYNRLTALLVKAIQELEARVVELEQAAQ